MLVIAVANGALRQSIFVKGMSELRSHQLSTVTGSVFMGMFIWFVVHIWPPSSSLQALAVGLIWLGLTVIFETFMGLVLQHRPMEQVLEQYNLLAGRVWVLLLAWITIAPLLFLRIQNATWALDIATDEVKTVTKISGTSTSLEVSVVNSKQLGALIGPTLGVILLSELPLIQPHLYDAQNPPVIYLSGIIMFVAGLAVVRAHNVWEKNWCVLITVTGWVLLLLGLIRMFAASQYQLAIQHTSSTTFIVLEVCLLVVALIITFNSYRPAPTPTEWFNASQSVLLDSPLLIPWFGPKSVEPWNGQ
jgi:hypothetical protein